MEGLEVAHGANWSLAWLFGFYHPFLIFSSPVIINTWLILIFLLLCCSICYLILHCTDTLVKQMVLLSVDSFNDLCMQGLGFFSLKHLSFITTIFIFILLCNICPIIPGMEEPTQDLNTTLALGLIAFLYIQYEAIKKNGLAAYIGGYFKPIFLLLPLNIIGKLATVMSMSFRLFGNIFGGALIAHIWSTTISHYWFVGILCIGPSLLITGFFTFFEGALQAFVFTMLALTHLGLALQGEGH
jgi:F-type H+-transporting ATPase subunit a